MKKNKIVNLKRMLCVLLLFVTIIGLTGCGSKKDDGGNNPTNSPSPIITPTKTPTNTIAPANTTTPNPSITPVATSTPIPKGNSSTTTDETFIRCPGSSCVGFASPNYICQKGSKIKVEVIVRKNNGSAGLKGIKLSNDNVSKKYLVGWSGYPELDSIDEVIEEYEIACNKVGSTELTATSDDGRTAKVTVKVVDKYVAIKSINLGISIAKMKVGDVKKITVKYNPTDATNKKIRWYTSNNKVAKVDQEGKITAISEGTARITAIAWNDDSKFQESHVDVTVSLDDDLPYVAFKTPSYVCGKGKQIVVKTVVCNDNIGNIEVSNSKLANPVFKTNEFIDHVKLCDTYSKCFQMIEEKKCNEATYQIECKKSGNTDLVLKTSSGKTIKASLKVVDKYTSVTSLSLGSFTGRNMKIGDKYHFGADIMPTNASNKKVYWSSSNPKAVIVDQGGTVTVVGKGKATITAKVYYDDTKSVKDQIVLNGYAKESDLTANDMLHFGRESGSCKVGGKVIVNLYRSFNNSKLPTLSSIKSLDTKVATIVESKMLQSNCIGCTTYEISCKKVGKTKIEAKTKEGGKATYNITVK